MYTENYASQYSKNPEKAIKDYQIAAKKATELGLEINAGHDLNLNNIEYFASKMPYLDEVSIGHALICESLYLGIQNVVNIYIDKLNRWF